MVRILTSVLWAIAWPVVAFFAIGFAMMGDPVAGGYEQQQLLGRTLLIGAVAIFLFGFWLILRKRAR